MFKLGRRVRTETRAVNENAAHRDDLETAVRLAEKTHVTCFPRWS